MRWPFTVGTRPDRTGTLDPPPATEQDTNVTTLGRGCVKASELAGVLDVHLRYETVAQ
jgi:hypothetical protein